MKLKLTAALIIATSFLIGCNINTENKAEQTQKLSIEKNDNSYARIADTIITDVVIRNPDHNEWTDYCLRNLKKDELVDQLFEMVYDGKLTPYDFFSETEMSIEEVKQFEKEEEFDRHKVGKVQFEESWHFDSENQKMMKQVISIMLAYETFDAEGNVKGYKPVFKVYFDGK